MAMHDITQTRPGRTAPRVPTTALGRPLETSEGRMDGHLQPRNVCFRE